MPREAKELKPTKDLEGISKRQIEEHHDVLYKGYVNKVNEIETRLADADLSEANATYSLIRELKREEVFATNGVRLHEAYFEALGGSGGPSGVIADLIGEDFGSVEKWDAGFRALGLAARGWVVLAYDWTDRELHNYLSDIHSDGVWDASVVLIMDVYEHAYFIDYGTARRRYIDAFMQNIAWDAINAKVERLDIVRHRRGN